jgi:hypothetical protein
LAPLNPLPRHTPPPLPPPAPAPEPDAAASEAAAVLARRKAEAAARQDDDAPVRMGDLDAVRRELLGELTKTSRRAEPVPHAVPAPTAAPAQKRTTGVGRIIGAVVAVLCLVALAVAAERRK